MLDLSKEFHPVPKPAKHEKKQPHKIGIGKKTKAWNSARADLKITFSLANIVSCEIKLAGCTNTYNLSFAHIDKRRFLSEEEVRRAVVLACINCHEIVERLPREQMRALLEGIIAGRVVPLNY